MGTHPIFESDFDCLTEKMPIFKGKSVNRFNFDKNRSSAAKRKKNKLKKKNTLKSKTVEETVLSKVWDDRRPLQQNLAAVGLSNDPNKSVKISKTRIGLTPESEAVVQKTLSNQQKEVLQELESAAKTEETKEWNVSQDDIHFCVHMLGQDWKAMAKDRKNYYQLTPSQIRMKIKMFRKSKASWNMYMEDRRDRGLEAIELKL